MEINLDEIEINGKTYVEKNSIVNNIPAQNLNGMPYCIIRTYSAGVFAGYVKERNGKEGVILKARRLWLWSGAASLSQLSVEGTNNPAECKFPCEVDNVELTEIIEVLSCTEKAKESINEVPIWKK